MIKIKKLFLGAQASSDFYSHDELVSLFKSHYENESEFLRSSIYWMVRSQAVDDIIQETFLKAWKSYSSFKKNSSFRTWIYRIAMNTTYDYLKKNQQYLSEELDDNVAEVAKGQNIELKDVITKALFKLSPEQREVFLLHYKLGHKQSEIAELTGIPEGTVKSRLFKARKVFTDFMNDIGVHHE